MALVLVVAAELRFVSDANEGESAEVRDSGLSLGVAEGYERMASRTMK
jgi:hypothetical protein